MKMTCLAACVLMIGCLFGCGGTEIRHASTETPAAPAQTLTLTGTVATFVATMPRAGTWCRITIPDENGKSVEFWVKTSTVMTGPDGEKTQTMRKGKKAEVTYFVNADGHNQAITIHFLE
jgi:hypothetical protein